MEFETTLDTNIRQNDNLVQLIQHENKLFQLDVHVDHSYHFQSHATIKNMTTLGTWEILTSFDVWGEFGGIDSTNPRIKIIKWEKIQEFVEKTIITYCKFIPKTQKNKENEKVCDCGHSEKDHNQKDGCTFQHSLDSDTDYKDHNGICVCTEFYKVEAEK